MQNIEQLNSSDPAHSVWVSASAGTGKTKVLTDRVLRLLLSGVLPAKILCLTFTTAAASEMISRINHELKIFAQSSDDNLNDKLVLLLGRQPATSELKLAKHLFFMMLESTEKVHVQTIHAFCQSLLRKFPFEAGIVPGFRVIDDIKADEILKKTGNIIFAQSNEGEIGEALKFTATNIHDSTMTELLREIIAAKIKFKTLIERFSSSSDFKIMLGKLMQAQNKTEKELIQDLLNELEANFEFKSLFSKLYNLDAFNAFSELKTQFFNKNGTLKKALMKKSEADKNPAMLNYLLEVQNKVVEVLDSIRTLRLINSSGYLFTIAAKIINEYEAYKKEHSFLDYDDLIYLSQKLLGSSEFRQWVLYKLDGGLEAILVDEAQDTSKPQWQIIESLMQEFYAGLDEKKRSIFVVGDEKQSIYSFQGASLNAYTGMNAYLKEQMLAAQKPYHIIDLAWSFRSTDAVIDLVGNTFRSFEEKLFPPIKQLKVFRNSHPGRVELWPLVKSEDRSDVFWPLFTEDMKEQTASEKLAKAIAVFIKKEMQSCKILPSTDRAPRLQDFMILLRRRGKLAKLLIKALQDEGVESGGIDRLALLESLSVLDILALAKFVLQPFDDLNLACLLKSPFIGISEEELRALVLPEKVRNKTHIYSTLKKQSPATFEKLEEFKDLYNAKSISEFFYIIIDGMNYRHKFLKQDGMEANDSINEFLYLADNFAKNVSSSMQEFVIWFEKNEIEIKRDASNNDKVRIMTVHGSKGLQAPVVILADTASLPKNSDKILWTDDEIPLWASSSGDKNAYFEKYKEELETREYSEYLRLLYVAMTRAEDHLVIAGESGESSISPISWYNVALEGIKKLKFTEEKYDFLDGEILVYETAGQSTKLLIEETVNGTLPLPPIFGNLDLDDDIKFSLKSGEIQGAPRSPLIAQKGVTYGHIFHKIMEDVIKTRTPYLERSHPMLSLLPYHQQKPISDKIIQLLSMKEFQEILELDVKTEVSLGMRGEIAAIGRIDLMATGNDRVIILDYKTDKNPPALGAEVPAQYLQQLNFYRKCAEKIYPQYKIETKILWLENLTFTNI